MAEVTQSNNGKVSSPGIIKYVPQEVDVFEREVKKFRNQEVEEATFMAFRLRQGTYGQRQPDAQMLRVKVPGGVLTADQLDALGELAEKYAPLKKGHVTTRENFQFHHLTLEGAAQAMRLIGEVGLTTREACANTVRNILSCPVGGVCPTEVFDVTPYLGAYARYFVRHPITQNFPRKWKTAFSPCASDCGVAGMHDMGLIARIQEIDGAPRKGFKLVIGGGTSIMPRVAPTLYEFVTVEDYLKVIEAAMRVFNRSDELRKNRMMARVKVMVDRLGIDAFRKLVEEELQQPWAQKEIKPDRFFYFSDEEEHAPPLVTGNGKHPSSPEFDHWVETNVIRQRQPGYAFAYVKVPLGDISDTQFHVLADLTRKYSGGQVRTTFEQNLAFRWIPEGALYDLWQGLKEIGLGDAGVHEITDVTACPGTDSCKLGITSSMGLGNAMRETLEGMNIEDPLIKKLHVKISGCPNGCGRHHVANIGFHGAAYKGEGGPNQVPAYEFFLGGNFENGDLRFGKRIVVKIPAKRGPEAVKVVLGYYKENRKDGEEFNQFVDRMGTKAFEQLLAPLKAVGPLGRDTIKYYMDWDKTVLFKVERGEGECSV